MKAFSPNTDAIAAIQKSREGRASGASFFVGLRSARGLGIVLLILVAALPVAMATVPGMADLPNHLARHHVFAVYGQGGPLDRYFEVEWRWIGNLGIDLPVLALTPWFGVETATRLMVGLIAPLTVAGLCLLSRSSHGRVTASAMLALPFAFAQPYLYGFTNYCFSIALALIVAALWNFYRPRTIGHALGFALAAVIVWTAHIMGWAVLLILVAGAELAGVRSWRDFLLRAVRAIPLLAPAVPLLVWRVQGDTILFWFSPDLLSAKLMNFVTMLKGLSQSFDLAMTAIIGLCAIAALVLAGSRRIEPRLAIGAGLLVVASLLLPTTVFGSWGADLRLTPIAVMIAILSIGPAASPAHERALFAIGVTLFLARVGWTTAEWARASAVLEKRLTILDSVPRGSRMGFIAIDDCGNGWVLTPDRKLGAYAVTRRDAFTNVLFQIPGADLMTFRAPKDRARWFDGSQDITARCPEGLPNRPALNARVAEMAQAGFDSIWIAGPAQGSLSLPAGYMLLRKTGHDQLIARR